MTHSSRVHADFCIRSGLPADLLMRLAVLFRHLDVDPVVVDIDMALAWTFERCGSRDAIAPKIDALTLSSFSGRSEGRTRITHVSHVGDPQGDPGLRDAIAAWLATHRAIAVDTSHIIVTRGIADFLTLLSQHLIRMGDRCAIEDPGHSLVRRALLKVGADLDHVPVDGEGLMVGRAFGAEKKPVLVHVTPNHQYPAGGRLSA